MSAAALQPQPTLPRLAPEPRVWLVLGDKRGDNGQVETLARALGWPCERRFVQMREPYVFGKPRVVPSLHHIDPERSDPLEPPWPDLILTIGRRPSMVALWIRAQSDGRSRIVLVGKPSGMIDHFDLIIASAEAQLPPLRNVMQITLPLMQVDRDAVARAATAWESRLGTLPRPLIGVLIGGPTGPYRYDRSVARRLIRLAQDVRGKGGTPYLTTSRRTPAAIVQALQAGLPEGCELYTWSPEAKDNPYLGLLGLADGLVVTGDSISMMVEVAKLRRPLQIFPLPCGRLGAVDQLRRRLAGRLFATSHKADAPHWLRLLAIAAFRTRLVTYTRDFNAFHQILIDQGLAARLGEDFVTPRASVPDDVGLAAARIRALMAEGA